MKPEPNSEKNVTNYAILRYIGTSEIRWTWVNSSRSVLVASLWN